MTAMRFTRFRWLPAEARPVDPSAARALPTARLVVLGAVVVVTLLHELAGNWPWPPWWLGPVLAIAVAALSLLSRPRGSAPHLPTLWLVREPDRVGLVRNDPDHYRAGPGSVIWLRLAELEVLQGLRARAAARAGYRLMDAAGHDGVPVEFGYDNDPDQDEYQAPQPSNPVLAMDRLAEFLVPSFAQDQKPLLLKAFGVTATVGPPMTVDPLDVRVSLNDLRTVAAAGIAPGYRLESSLGGYARRVEVDLFLGFDDARCWPSIVDGLTIAQLGALDRAGLGEILRADLEAQVERDLRWEQQRGESDPITPDWARRWRRQLDTFAERDSSANSTLSTVDSDRPPLTEVAMAALRLCATETDRTDTPLRPKLVPLGVPETVPGQPLRWPRGRRGWWLLDRLLIGATVLLVAFPIAPFGQ